MALVEPITDEPAAIATLDGERALVLADYHAGVETALRSEGVELKSRAENRREQLFRLLDQTAPDRLIVVGDLAHWIGEPKGQEYEELADLIAYLPDSITLTVVKGNHDGAIDTRLNIETTDPRGARFGDVGFTHGHTWPAHDVLRADVVCMGHEHPVVRLEDVVGGRRVERVWLRGALEAPAFEDHGGSDGIDGELIVVPAFNDLVGGTWINVESQEFLSPFLPQGLSDGEAYLLDGTRLGEYREVS